jgi:hypothetical protein
MVRSYIVSQALEFGTSQCTPAVRKHLENGASEQLRASLGYQSPSDWCPREHLVEVLTAVAELDGRNARQEQLVACGQYINERSANAFTNLLMGILTPALFVKKLPRFWQREHRGAARLELDRSEEPGSVVRFRLNGVAGYDHIALVWLGWMQSSLRQMGHPEANITQQGWTPTVPGPAAVLYELRWS